MIQGLYTAMTGMDVQQAKVDSITNNLSNVNTNGYKKENVLVTSFPSVMLAWEGDGAPGGRVPIGNTNDGVMVNSVVLDQSPGQYEQTEKPTDLALKGSGYFVVSPPGSNTAYYTRDGSFSINSSGYLVNSQGYQVQGQAGPIQLSGTDIKVASDGTVTQGGQTVDQIKTVDFSNPGVLQKAGNNLFTANGGTPVATGANTTVLQGTLEKSNVNLNRELVDVLSAYRSYELNQKMIQAADNLLDKAANQVGSLK